MRSLFPKRHFESTHQGCHFIILFLCAKCRKTTKTGSEIFNVSYCNIRENFFIESRGKHSCQSAAVMGTSRSLNNALHILPNCAHLKFVENRKIWGSLPERFQSCQLLRISKVPLPGLNSLLFFQCTAFCTECKVIYFDLGSLAPHGINKHFSFE